MKEFDRRRRIAALTQLGMDLYGRARFGEALNRMEDALALNAVYERALRGKALCLTQLGRAQEALAVAELALERYPESGLNYSTRGLCLHRAGRSAEAEADFERAVELAAEDYRVYYNYACFWAERGDEERCRRYFGYALEAAPENFAYVPPADPDLARYSRREWFLDLLAHLKQRAQSS